MPNKYYQRKHVTDIKIFLKKQKDKKRPKKDIKTLMKKEKKKCQYYCSRNQSLSKEQNQMLVEYRRNYYVTHNK